MMKLSEKLQRDHDCGDFGKALEGYAECAKELEAEVKHLREQLSAYEAEPVELPYLPAPYQRGNLGIDLFDTFQMHQYAIRYLDMNKPTSTAHLEAIKAQVWNEAMEEAASIAEHIAQNGLGGAPTCVRAIRAAKKG